jgi:hypothetical protein
MPSRTVVKAGQKVLPQPEVMDRAKKTLHLPLDVAAQLKAHVASQLGQGVRVTETDIVVAALREWLDAADRGKR